MARTRRWTRPRPTRRQVRFDVALAVVLALGALVTLELGRVQGATLGGVPPSVLEQTLWTLGITLPLAVRRLLPLATLVVVAAVFFGLQARFVPEVFLSSVSLYLALVTAGAWGRDRRATHVVRTLVVGAMFAWLTYGLFETPYGDLIPDEAAPGRAVSPRTAYLLLAYGFNAVYFGAAVAFGELAWRSARQRAALAQRTGELEAEREHVARSTREAERLVVARDLHDVVAHHVSLMGVQAGAARRAFDKDPDRARDALSHVETTSRTAVEEMRRMLEVLRGGDTVGAPAVSGLPALVEQAGTGDLEIALTVVGPERELPASVSAAAYRVAQEALTNTVKHARARRADVRLRYLDHAVEVEVVDDGQGAMTTPQPGAHGQAGMRERVALHDGDLEMGPRHGGGYRVRARFPA